MIKVIIPYTLFVIGVLIFALYGFWLACENKSLARESELRKIIKEELRKKKDVSK